MCVGVCSADTSGWMVGSDVAEFGPWESESIWMSVEDHSAGRWGKNTKQTWLSQEPPVCWDVCDFVSETCPDVCQGVYQVAVGRRNF